MSRSLVFKPGPQSGPVIEKCFSSPLRVFDALYYLWSLLQARGSLYISVDRTLWLLAISFGGKEWEKREGK
jgi:hypothetical protein